MEILGNLSYKMLFVFLLCAEPICLSANRNIRIDSIRITYSQIHGYGIHSYTACYKLSKKVYKLQMTNSENQQLLKDAISKRVVDRLVKDCSQHATENLCNLIRITNTDYSNYINTLNGDLPNYIPYIHRSKRELYELKEEFFTSLKCDEIIEILTSDNHPFVYFIPLFKIQLYGPDINTISIKPISYFQGTAWSVLNNDKETYMDFKYINPFLRNTAFDKYVFFYERFYLLYQIADSFIRNQEIGDLYYEAGSSGSIGQFF